MKIMLSKVCKKNIPFKLGLLHVPKAIPHEPAKTSQNFTSKLSHKKKKKLFQALTET